MKAVITVLGKDMVGILSKISLACTDRHANIIEITQSVMQDLFAMIMLVDISKLNSSFTSFSEELQQAGKEMNLVVHVMHEDIFNAMHTI